jgi:hypothetical protein
VQPIGVNLSDFDEASLSLLASGAAARTVASSSSLPASDDANLQVVSSVATSFVTAPNFSGELTVVPTSLRESADYVLTATVRLRIEVEGV